MKTKLGQAVIYDTLVHHGPGKVRKWIAETTTSVGFTPSTRGDEEVWIRELLHKRKNAPYRKPLKIIVENRVAQLEKLMDKGDWDLKTIAQHDIAPDV